MKARIAKGVALQAMLLVRFSGESVMSNRALIANAAFGRASLAVTLAAVLGVPLPSVAGIDARDRQSTAMQTPSAPASHSVTTCVDDANLQGSLRYEVQHASNNDIIDLTALQCSKITLTSEIDVLQDSLLLEGPGSKYLTIDGDDHYRIFKHTGNSVLAIEGLTIANGYYFDSNKPFGGCIYSYADISLVDSVVSTCIVASASSSIPARGGGVYARSALTLNKSEISSNRAIAHYGAHAYGGGVYAQDLISRYSTIADNQTETPGYNVGGGAAVRGNAYFGSSTIAGNRAFHGGGLDVLNPGFVGRVVNSTISSNLANVYAGLYSNSPLSIESSTIAFNSSPYLSSDRGEGVFSRAPIILKSSIISGNAAGGSPADLSGDANATVTGSNSLVVFSAIAVPMGTHSECPRLGPLAKNGGPTLTHALGHASPAIDQGNAGMLTSDQRLEPRVSGAGADIGAFERQAGEGEDRVFVSGFGLLCDQ